MLVDLTVKLKRVRYPLVAYTIGMITLLRYGSNTSAKKKGEPDVIEPHTRVLPVCFLFISSGNLDVVAVLVCFVLFYAVVSKLVFAVLSGLHYALLLVALPLSFFWVFLPFLSTFSSMLCFVLCSFLPFLPKTFVYCCVCFVLFFSGSVDYSAR